MKKSGDEISIYFISDQKMRDLHAEHFEDPSPTDCITFPVDASYLGDLFICPQTALSYAHKTGRDPFEETLLYLVHGILHIVGYDDLQQAARRKMRQMEKRCLNHLKKGLKPPHALRDLI